MASGAPGTEHRTSLPENAMIDVARARADTPAVESLDYFYSCGAGLMPTQVLDALHGHLDREAEIGGSMPRRKRRSPRLAPPTSRLHVC